MSFLKNIKNALGFGYDEDADIEVGEPMISELSSVKVPEHTPVVNDPECPLQASPQMVHMIFDKVVEVTNAAVPQYLASALNPERQRQYLYDALDQSVQAYLQQLEAQAQNRCEAMWKGQRDDLKHEMDILKQRAADLEARRTEINEQKLSAERQKRALNERVHDLEANIMKLEAEKEQLEIENRSLINKAKVATVYENDIEQMRQQLQQLQSQPADTNDAAEEIASLNVEIAQLRVQNDALTQALEAARVKDEMSEAMVKDWQKRSSESQQKSKVNEDMIAELQSRISHLEAMTDDLKREIADKDARIAEDEAAFGDLQEIAEQMQRFEEVKKRLQEQVLKLKAQVNELQVENLTQKDTISKNLYAHAQREKTLIDQIEQLRAAADHNQ